MKHEQKVVAIGAASGVGYRMHPLYRAPGMSATAYMNLGMIGYVLYEVMRLGQL